MTTREKQVKEDGGEVVVATVKLCERKGRGIRLYLPVAMSKWYREEKIDFVELVMKRLGGAILIKPVTRGGSLERELEDALNA